MKQVLWDRKHGHLHQKNHINQTSPTECKAKLPELEESYIYPMSPMACKAQPSELEESHKSVVVKVGNMPPPEGHTMFLRDHKGMIEN
jgi:hypothetical protein